MKKPSQIITLLESVTESRHIYDMDEARWLSRFAKENPQFLRLKHSEDTNPNAPYFSATLTGQGRTYLAIFKRENNYARA